MNLKRPTVQCPGFNRSAGYSLASLLWPLEGRLLGSVPPLMNRLRTSKGLQLDNRQLGVPEFGSILASGNCGIALTVSAV